MRPSVYSDEVAVEILQRMCNGESVKSICNDDHMPARSTVMLWVAEDREGFSDKYAMAAEARAHYWADELLDIADDASNDYMMKNDPENPGYITNGETLARSRLRVDSRKWLLSKMLPRYADRQEIKHSGSLDLNQLSDEELNNKLLALMNEHSIVNPQTED